MKKITILTFIISLMVASSIMAQTTYYVSASGGSITTGADGSAALPFINVGLAINAAVTGDTIIIDGTAGPVNQNSQSSIDFTKNNLTITGINPPVIINGSGLLPGLRMFNVQAGLTVTFSGITFTGVVDGGQGAVMTGQLGSAIIIDDCVFDNNSALGGNGGAIYMPAGNLDIKNSLFKNNSCRENPLAVPAVTARRGGAIYTNGLSNVSITNSTFYNNSADNRGGAIYMAASPVGTPGSFTMTNCTVAGNSLNFDNISRSGGVRIDANITTLIQNSLLYGNTYLTTDIDTGLPTTSPSDFAIAGLAGTTLLTVRNSIIGQVAGGTIFGDIDENSVIALAALDLIYTEIEDGTSEFVKYENATYPVLRGDATLLLPITTDQGGNSRAAGNDVGAWASGFTTVLSTTSNKLASSLNVFYTQTNKSINIINPLDLDVSLEVYSLLGTKVLSLGRINTAEPVSVSSLNSGLYLLLAKSTTNGASTTKKFIVN